MDGRHDQKASQDAAVCTATTAAWASGDTANTADTGMPGANSRWPTSGGPGGELCRTLTRTVLSLRSLEDVQLLRGTPLSSIMRRGGGILRSKVGDNDTFNLSRPVEKIEFFISHNWSTPGHLKYAALVLYFNSSRALAVSLLTGGLCSALVATGCLPLVPWCQNWEVMPRLSLMPGSEGSDCGALGADPEAALRSFWCTGAGYAALVVVLLFYHDAVLCCPGCQEEPVVFLDKVCIHQTDPEVKRRGIEGLAAFLGCSDKLVVLYTDVYLRRLWTVYELASFLALHSREQMVLLCVSTTRLLAFCIVAVALVASSAQVMNTKKVRDALGDFFYLLLCLIFASECAVMAVAAGLIRQRQRERAALQEEVQTFSIRKAACYDETDRTLVERNTAVFMKHLNRVDRDAPESEALAAFDQLVHQELPQAMAESFGQAGLLPYRYVVLAFVGVSLSSLDQLGTMLLTGRTAAEVAIVMSRYVVTHLAFWPLASAFAAMHLRQWLHLDGWAERAFLVSSVCYWLGVCALWFGFYQLSLAATGGSGLSLVALAVAEVALVSLTVAIYAPRLPFSRFPGSKTLRPAKPAHQPEPTEEESDKKVEVVVADEEEAEADFCAVPSEANLCWPSPPLSACLDPSKAPQVPLARSGPSLGQPEGCQQVFHDIANIVQEPSLSL